MLQEILTSQMVNQVHYQQAPGLWLTVTIEDTRRADAPAIQLGQSMRQITKYNSKNGLRFSVDF